MNFRLPINSQLLISTVVLLLSLAVCKKFYAYERKLPTTELSMKKNFLTSGPLSGCSKLTTSLVNVSLNFQTLTSEIRQCVLLKKREKLL